MQVNLDGSTKIIPANRIGVAQMKGKGAAKSEPIDFARDTILVLCPVTHRPLGIYTPTHKQPGSTAPPPPPRQEVSRETVEETVERSASGRLSEAHKERLERIWREHPNWSEGKVGEEFERTCGRSISVLTVGKYRPALIPNGVK